MPSLLSRNWQVVMHCTIFKIRSYLEIFSSEQRFSSNLILVSWEGVFASFWSMFRALISDTSRVWRSRCLCSHATSDQLFTAPNQYELFHENYLSAPILWSTPKGNYFSLPNDFEHLGSKILIAKKSSKSNVWKALGAIIGSQTWGVPHQA